AALHEGAEVAVLLEEPPGTVPERLRPIAGDVEIRSASLADRSALAAAVESRSPDTVLHLAAFTHVGRSFTHVDDCVQTNVVGTVNLLCVLDAVPYRRFVYTSTSEVYGDVPVPFREDGPVNPVSPYAVTKHSAEQM